MISRHGEPPARPRTLADEAERDLRRSMLSLPHVKKLTAFREKLLVRVGVEVPYFDPLDGGIDARILFLFEKPGPMTDATRSGRAGSGFISRDNDDPTAHATFEFMQRAGIPRKASLLWNVVPWWDGTRKIPAAQLEEGVGALRDLVTLLPALEVIVLVGKKAQRATPLFGGLELALLTSSHPSPIVRATRREVWDRIPEEWAACHESLRSPLSVRYPA